MFRVRAPGVQSSCSHFERLDTTKLAVAIEAWCGAAVLLEVHTNVLVDSWCHIHGLDDTWF